MKRFWKWLAERLVLSCILVVGFVGGTIFLSIGYGLLACAGYVLFRIFVIPRDLYDP